jgi:hypothetical protein
MLEEHNNMRDVVSEAVHKEACCSLPPRQGYACSEHEILQIPCSGFQLLNLKMVCQKLFG